MSEEIDHYVNRQGIKGDTNFLVEELNKSIQLFERLEALSKTIGTSATPSKIISTAKESKVVIDDLVKSHDKLKKSQDDLAASALVAAKVKTEEKKQSTELAKAQTEEKKQATETAKAKTESARASKESAKAKEIEVRMTERLAKEKDKAEKLAAREKKVLDDLTNEYKIFSKASAEAQLKAKNYALTLGEQHPVTIQAIKDANEYNDRLIHLDELVGTHTRKVGNYERASFALNQVIREAPAFANSFATGISAIGNNVPMLVDEFKKLKEATGSNFQAFKILAGGLLSFTALLPIGFLLIQSYGKEIATFFKSLVSSKEALDRFKESQQALNEAIKGSEYKKAITDIEEMKNVIQLAKDGVVDKTAALKKYNEGIGEVIGKASSLNEAEQLLVKNGPAYIQMMLAKAAANVAMGKAAEKAVEAEELRRKKEDEFLTKGDKISTTTLTSAPGAIPVDLIQQAEKTGKAARAAAAIRRKQEAVKEKDEEVNSFKDIATSFNKQMEDIAKANKFNLTSLFADNDDKGKDKTSEIQKRLADQRKAAFELRKLFIQDEIETQKVIAQNEGLSFAVRRRAREKQLDSERELITLQRDFEINEIEVKAKEEKQAIENYADEIAIVQKKSSDEEAEIKTKAAVDIIEIRKQIADGEKAALDELNAYINAELAKQLSKEQAAAAERLKARNEGIAGTMNSEYSDLLQQYKAGAVTKEEFEAKKLAIENKYRSQSLESELTYVQEILNLSGLSTDERLKFEERLNAIKNEKRKEDFEAEKIYSEKRYELQKNLNDRLKGLAQQTFDALREITGYQFEKDKNAVQDQIDLLQEKARKEVEIANQTIANTQERADTIAIIESRANFNKERLEARKRQIDQSRAKFEQGAAAFNIGIQTLQDVFKIKAQAAVLASNPITAALAPLALAQIPVVSISGAIAAGLVLSKPLPKYFKGRDKNDPYTGFAWVGDGGKPEAIIRKSGDVEIGGSKPRVTWLEKGDTVLPDANALMAIAKSSTDRTMAKAASLHQPNHNANLEREIKGMRKDVVSAIKSIPQPIIQTESKVKKWVRSSGSINEFL